MIICYSSKPSWPEGR